jgi:predicted nucleotidyltransferase
MHIKNKVYCSSLRRTAKKLASRIGPDSDVVLLGSLATGKYVEILNPIFGSRLVAKFIGSVI